MSTYADITINDPNPIKRWIQHQRFRDAIAILRNAKPGAEFGVLDFGGGDGELLRQCLSAFPFLRASLYEPTPAIRREAETKLAPYEGVEIVGDLNRLREQRFDLLFCLEVFEHLPPQATDEAIAAIHGLTKPAGLVVIGVPHEIFLPALVKGLFRMARRFGAFDGRPANVVRASLGRPPKGRPTKEIAPGFSYYRYHLGFDHRELQRALDRRFETVSQWFSPLRPLGQIFNSEVYYLLRPR
ncbi:MAG TPA: class I SAM-dependent methyltransferase [Gemmatimonadaceae bacterium]|jgi:SAM-dependent methyltransferase|nr:class I SAM-dependent methyltransferase [Gemmatimonadaceae bacterium]